MDVAVSDLAAANAKVVSYHKVVELLQQRLRAKTQDMLGVAAKEQQLQERISDQQAFIEVGRDGGGGWGREGSRSCEGGKWEGGGRGLGEGLREGSRSL